MTLSREQLLCAALEEAIDELVAWVEENTSGERYLRDMARIDRLRHVLHDKKS